MMPTCVTTVTMLAIKPMDPQTLILIGIILILGTLFIWRSRTRTGGSRVDARAGAQSQMHNTRLATQARDDLNELMLRLEELSREICGQIDTRFAKLEHAIREADAKLAALRAVGAAPAAAEHAEPVDPVDPKHADICRRAAEGQTELQIARDMGMNIGEVELILSLQRSRRSATPLTAPPPADEPDEPKPPRGLQLDERA